MKHPFGSIKRIIYAFVYVCIFFVRTKTILFHFFLPSLVQKRKKTQVLRSFMQKYTSDATAATFAICSRRSRYLLVLETREIGGNSAYPLHQSFLCHCDAILPSVNTYIHATLVFSPLCTDHLTPKYTPFIGNLD